MQQVRNRNAERHQYDGENNQQKARRIAGSIPGHFSAFKAVQCSDEPKSRCRKQTAQPVHKTHSARINAFALYAVTAQIFIHNPRADKIHRRNNAGKPHSDEYAAGNGAVQVFRKIQRNKGQTQPNKHGTPHGHKGKLFNQNGPYGNAAHRQKQYDAEQDGVRRSRQTQRIVHVKRNRRHNEGQSRAVKSVRKAEQPKAQVGEHIAQGRKELWFYRIIAERRFFTSDRHVQNNRAGK